MLRLNHFTKSGLILLVSLLTAGCGGSGDEYDGFENPVTVSTPDSFLTFFNRQGDLAADSYTIVVATATIGEAGTFGLSIQRNTDSTAQISNGSWTSSAGDNGVCGSGNPCFPLDMQDATGVTITLNTALDGILYLLDNGNGAIVDTVNLGAAGGAETLYYSESATDETNFANAYYDAIDPANRRTTLQDYISLHGLQNPDVHVIFRDSKDLGYGRDMYMRTYTNPSCGGEQVVAFYVRNFSVNIVPGFAYGPVNLEAAIDQDLQYHFGSNAIEFSSGRGDVGDPCTSEPMAKFYTFMSDYSTPNAVHPRLNRIDLDGRGAKAMPQPCIACHGGKLRPLDRMGRFVTMHANDPVSDIGNTKSRMQAFEVDTFEFSDKVGYRQVDYEEGLRLLNAAIYCTYPGSQGHPACALPLTGVASQTDEGEWSGDFGREMLLGWYGNNLEVPGTAYDASFVPTGWTPSIGGPPEGADTLFLEVVGPNCFVCHGKRGTELGSDNSTGTFDDASDGKDLDFGSFDKFISHADEIERLVFDEGKMPMGLLNYNNFWQDPEKAEILATFIAPYVSDPAGFSARRTDSAGNIILPGRVVARAGPDRVTAINEAITLNAQATLFAQSYSWSVLSSPGGSTYSVSSASSMKSDFSADTNGIYVIRLTASSSQGSDSDTMTVLLDIGVPVPRNLQFYNGGPGQTITTRLMSCAAECHSVGGGTTGGAVAGIPVWWVSDANQPLGGVPAIATTPVLGLYEQVMARVNLENIEDSLMLKKPSNIHHFGGLQATFDISTVLGSPARADFDMFVNWIAEGAVCGGTAAECIR